MISGSITMKLTGPDEVSKLGTKPPIMPIAAKLAAVSSMDNGYLKNAIEFNSDYQDTDLGQTAKIGRENLKSGGSGSVNGKHRETIGIDSAGLNSLKNLIKRNSQAESGQMKFGVIDADGPNCDLKGISQDMEDMTIIKKPSAQVEVT